MPAQSHLRIFGAKVLLLVILLFSFMGAPCLAQKLDKYGGVEAVQCSAKTGYFRTEKIGDRWWFCTPEGHGFFLMGVYVVAPLQQNDDQGRNYYQIASKKYGDPGPRWAEQTLRRLQSWGFNALGLYASLHALPTSEDSDFPRDSKGFHSDPIKLPFVINVRPAFYSMTNPAISVVPWKDEKLLADPVKNMMYAVSRFYHEWNPPSGVADYYDPKMYEWLQKDLTEERFWNAIRKSPYLPYLIGISSDDGDQMYGFGAGNEFPTQPEGHNNAHLAWIVATISPVQAANPADYALYADPVIHSKLAWRDMLAAKYRSIQALNLAWGSNYSTFDSSGTQINNELIGKGDGKTLNFQLALTHLAPSRFSVQIMVDGRVVAGDAGNGMLWGPHLRGGTIDYRSGRVRINFPAGNAPPAGAAITATYMQNGWEIGSGLMDEDGRPSHQAWLGNDYMSLKDTKPNTRQDLNDFLEAISGQYLGKCRQAIQAVFPHVLYLGPDSIGSWSIPARREVLKSAGKYVDVMVTGGMASFSQNMTDYVAQYYGDKPYFEGEYRSANADSALSKYSDSSVGGFASQAARGEAYAAAIRTLRNRVVTATGSHPYIGAIWWQFSDNWPERKNWGLVTNLDNAYDGHEDVSARVSCSPPLTKYECGGEDRNYGDVLTSVKLANRYWLEGLVQGGANSKTSHNQAARKSMTH